MKTYGVKLRILALCCASGEMLYLAYQGHPQAGLRRYAQRWQCENMHQRDGPISAAYPKTKSQGTWV